MMLPSPFAPYKLPEMCVCCASSSAQHLVATRQQIFLAGLSGTLALAFSYCDRCHPHAAWAARSGISRLGGALLGKRRSRAPDAGCCAGEPVSFDAWEALDGGIGHTVSFTFGNPLFENMFSFMNLGKFSSPLR